jgi:hypothetical protein
MQETGGTLHLACLLREQIRTTHSGMVAWVTRRRNLMTAKIETGSESGAVLFIPLNKLKKSPKNARKTPHSEAEIEALRRGW